MSYLLFPLVVYIPVGTYLYFFFRRFLGLFGLGKQKKAVRILSLLITLACVAQGWMLYGLGAVIILHFFCAQYFDGWHLLYLQRKVPKGKSP